MNFLKDVFLLYFERSDFFIEIFLEHVVLTTTAALIITVLGLTIGISMTRDKRFANIILAVTNFIYTIPSIALFGFLVTLVGIGSKNAIIALVVYGLLPIIRNTYVGIMEVDEEIIESAIGMGSTKKQLLLKIQLPLALPVIFAGFRTMVIMTIALGAIASFIGAGGLGVAIWRGITTYFPEMTMAGSLLVAGFAVLVDFILGKIETSLRKRVLGKAKVS